MLTKIEVDDLQGNTLSLPLEISSSGYQLRSVDGLDPVKSSIVYSSFAQMDGSQFQSARRENRNIIITIGMEPYSGGSTVRELKNGLYAYFMPKTNVRVKFYDDDILFAQIDGQVESCEAPVFTQDPEMAVSLICFDPNFSAPAETSLSGNTVSTGTETTITNTGTVESGFVLTVNVNRTMSGFSVYVRRPNGDTAVMDLSYSLLAGDVVKISTQPRNKYVTVTRSGVTTSIVYAVSTASKYAQIPAGVSYFRVQASGAAVPYTLAYTKKYGGL